jgi:hypothetical protein
VRSILFKGGDFCKPGTSIGLILCWLLYAPQHTYVCPDSVPRMYSPCTHMWPHLRASHFSRGKAEVGSGMSGIALMSANWISPWVPHPHHTFLLTEEGRKFCVCVRILTAGPEVGMTGTQIALAYVDKLHKPTKKNTRLVRLQFGLTIFCTNHTTSPKTLLDQKLYSHLLRVLFKSFVSVTPYYAGRRHVSPDSSFLHSRPLLSLHSLHHKIHRWQTVRRTHQKATNQLTATGHNG